MKKFIPLPAIESGFSMFGGHMRTVPGGWSFFEQKHQAFELLCVLEGHQTTKIENLPPFIYGPGDVIIISPGTNHINYNTSKTECMTYVCFHFNIEDLKIKSEIIKDATNTIISKDSKLAQLAIRTSKSMLNSSEDKLIGTEERNIEIQIIFLKFLANLLRGLKTANKDRILSYSEREAQVSRMMASMIETGVKNNEYNFNVGSICHRLNISNGYGHRVFKKVYGVTPLHYIEEQKYRKSKLLLGMPEYSIEEVSYLIGFKSLSNFSKQLKKWAKISPSKYQQQIFHRRKVRGIKESGYFE